MGALARGIRHVEHVQDRAISLECDNAAAARSEILTPTLLFIADLQQESMAELSFLEGGWLQRQSLYPWQTNSDQ